MVGALHAAGIEVVLDVVFNHTCEGGADGPTLSLARPGRRRPTTSLDARGRDVDLTGCGNTLDAGSPTVVRLVTDSLRHWVTSWASTASASTSPRAGPAPRRRPFDPAAPLLTAIALGPGALARAS